MNYSINGNQVVVSILMPILIRTRLGDRNKTQKR